MFYMKCDKQNKNDSNGEIKTITVKPKVSKAYKRKLLSEYAEILFSTRKKTDLHKAQTNAKPIKVHS